METDNEKNQSLSLSRHIKLCLGIFLLSFSVIALTGKTVVGEFLAYCFAYLFGSFFPVFAAFFFALGLVLIICGKFPPIKHHLFLHLGIILILLSVLSLGSISLAKESSTLSFVNFTDFYGKKIKYFAQTPFTVDSLEAMSTLGGGYIGLALLTLFSSVWGLVGDMVFFVILLLVGAFFALFAPTRDVILKMKKKKAEKVEYNSPFHPEKGKEKKALDRNHPVQSTENKEEIDPELKRPLSNDWQRTSSIPTESVFEATLTRSFATDDIQAEKEEQVVEPKPSVNKPVENPKPVFTEPKPIFTEPKPVERPIVSQNTTTTPVLPERNAFSAPTFEGFEQFDTNKEAENFTKSAKSAKSSTFDVIEPIVPDVPMRNEVEHQEKKVVIPVVETKTQEEPAPTVFQNPSFNPLEDVAKTVTPRAKKEETNTVQIQYPVEEKKEEPIENDAPAIMDAEEESETEIEKRYFYEKQQRAIEKIQQKQRERNERKANLMRFVSDTPKVYRYALPTDALLQEHDDSEKKLINSDAAAKKVDTINEVFKNYGVKAKAVSYTVGASVTRFDIETEPGEKSDRLASLVDELQKALNGDKSVRVETVVEGKSTSGIEVGNAKPMAVSFKDVFEVVETNTSDNLLLPIGMDISGNIITSPLNKMPHLLIAGTTGSGKSVLVHSMIMTLIMRNYPSQMKLILIDPKQVEFIRYQECSHLFCPVISQPEKAVLALKKLVDEMNRRFTVFSKYKAPNIEGYNKIRKGQEALMEEMPYLVCVIDEFADLMMTGGKDVVSNVQKIGQKARAAGIHMIIATQRPSKDTVPMMIKANVPCRIGLSCSAQVDSRVILDENGAETLLGRGDLLFKDPGKKSLVRAQSPFLSDEEIDSVLAYVKEKAGDPVYDQAFLELEDDEEENPNVEEVDPQKRLYDDIKDFVIHTGITSKESIIRNFQVTSSKADNYLATMVSEDVLMMGFGGHYVLGPAAITARQKEGL